MYVCMHVCMLHMYVKYVCVCACAWVCVCVFGKWVTRLNEQIVNTSRLRVSPLPRLSQLKSKPRNLP